MRAVLIQISSWQLSLVAAQYFLPVCDCSWNRLPACCCCCFFNTWFLLFFNLFYLFLAVLGLRFCARAFSSCGKWGPLFIAVCGPLTVAASLVAEHRLQTRRLSSCGSQAQLLCGMWDLPGPGLEPVSPALAGRLSTTVPPGKPPSCCFRPSRSMYLLIKLVLFKRKEYRQQSH